MMSVAVLNYPSVLSLLASSTKPAPPLLPHPPTGRGRTTSSSTAVSTFLPSLTGNWTIGQRRDRDRGIRASPATEISSFGFDDGETPSVPLLSASDVVRNFYAGINRHDLAAVEGLIAENCVYEDLIFPRPFTGRQAILKFFKKFTDSISTDLQFVIDNISDEDSSAVGVTWHLEWSGRPFPFSKGCSFYKLAVMNGVRQIIFARDSVEPALKPGELALAGIRIVTWLLQQFPQIADRL
ncbi:hypothetical protein Dimus_021035 [Dionaea muscipula]